MVRAAAEWAAQGPDDDTWDGFYLSLDLLDPPPNEENRDD
jgi:hypothetical protein